MKRYKKSVYSLQITGLPSILIDTPLQRLWYKQDDAFLLPKACVSIELTSPYAYMDPLSCNLTYMFVSLFRDALNEYAYDAELAGLVYDLNNTVYGLTVSIYFVYIHTVTQILGLVHL